MAKVFITGIAGGFDPTTARGHMVAGSVRSRTGRNADTVAALEAEGSWIVEMDVTDTASTEACIIAPGNMPTAFLDGMVTPNDPTLEAQYGDFAAVPALSAQGLAQMLDATTNQRPERIAEAVVALLALPFSQKPFRTVVDHTGVAPKIERYNTVLQDVTRTVLTRFGIADMLRLNA
ncbi:hypothetical protein LGQ03_04355 [Loktanella sp. TSTF-M6]|uniref:Uncharacterized protein n=1 Tax=Loktanella gaetbuli TaxID=2881335 RepID=A0ABS8BRX2_9RHOB|nr:hypothetical protein [Loktanella gaetbuli]MCB5198465.1 hypothetical protein [Loktanella gaetbuli]